MKSRREQYKQWMKTRPPIIRATLRALRPDRTYRIKETGQIATIYSASEDGTVTVTTSDFFGVMHYRVFGLKPSDLERATQAKEH